MVHLPVSTWATQHLSHGHAYTLDLGTYHLGEMREADS